MLSMRKFCWKLLERKTILILQGKCWNWKVIALIKAGCFTDFSVAFAWVVLNNLFSD